MGDQDGNGIDNVGVNCDSIWFILDINGDGAFDVSGLAAVFGVLGDTLVVGKWTAAESASPWARSVFPPALVWPAPIATSEDNVASSADKPSPDPTGRSERQRCPRVPARGPDDNATVFHGFLFGPGKP